MRNFINSTVFESKTNAKGGLLNTYFMTLQSFAFHILVNVLKFEIVNFVKTQFFSIFKRFTLRNGDIGGMQCLLLIN